MRIGYQKNETLMVKVLDFIGAQGRTNTTGDDPTQGQKLSFKPQILNPIETNDIDYHLSHECQML